MSRSVYRVLHGHRCSLHACSRLGQDVTSDEAWPLSALKKAFVTETKVPDIVSMSLRFILKILLKFRKFQPRYMYSDKIYL